MSAAAGGVLLSVLCRRLSTDNRHNSIDIIMDKQFITTVNGIEIAAVRDEDLNFFVPVKPLCEAIGVDPEAQRQRIMRHYILDLKGSCRR